tara:strand:+ start:15364 stop:15753 length:390 start_codon:yes stop_codon:yes gene_type:complete
MAPSNVSDLAAEEDGLALRLGVGILEDWAGLQHFALDQGHVVRVDNGAAEVVHDVFEAADAALQAHKVLPVQACKVMRWARRLPPSLADETHAAGLWHEDGFGVGTGHVGGGPGKRRHMREDVAEEKQA